MNNIELYKELCRKEDSIHLYHQSWWLDVVAKGEWDVVLVNKGGAIYAALPYIVKKKLGFTYLTNPPLTPMLGPWLRSSTANSRLCKKLALEKEILTNLIDKLPKYDLYHQSWCPTLSNWLPFYWRGFKQTSKYTYRIENIADLNSVWSGFQNNIRTDIRKAEKSGIIIRDDLPIDSFIELNEMTFTRQGLEPSYNSEFIKELAEQASSNSCCKWFIAQDSQGRNHAGAFLVWDKNVAYYLLGGGNPELRNSGATSLCLWEAIKFSSGVSNEFDFEGSMIEPIEKFFRGFGAKQVPYFVISHYRNKTLYRMKSLKGLFKGC